jgi:hypothetical protein
MTLERNKKFLARYYYDGSWWCIDFYAADFDDAESICNAHNLQLDGEHVMTIPAVGGTWLLPNLIIRIRNAFAR